MTQKIFRSACLTLLLVIVAFFITAVPITVSYCTDAIKKELKTEAKYLLRGLDTVGFEYLEETAEGGNRVTLISSEGTVIYDNSASPSEMENHLNREEIREAMENGEGDSVRRSATLSELTVYYAVRLSDGSVLRVSGEAVSPGDLSFRLTPAAAVILAVALALSIFFALNTSQGITAELEKIDLERPSDQTAYAELRPILKKLTDQSQLITRQMEELRLRRHEFESITQNMDDGLILIDERARILSSNKIAASLLGLAPSELAVEQLTLNNQSLHRFNADKQVRKVISDSLLGTKGEAFISTEEKTYRMIAEPVMLDGAVSGVAILMLDETEKEKREELRREFTSNISHELKTPLTSISGFAELIRSGIAGDNALHFADNIYKEAQRLITLVNDIIKLSRLDGKTPGLNFVPTDLRQAAEAVVERLRPVAEASGIEISVSGTPETVTADRKLLDEIIYNLCDNAVKYGVSGGKAAVTVEKRTDGRAQLTVADNGIGIPTEQLDRVFERFYRVDKSHSKEIGGTGLGLSIVKHGVACHRGEVTLESEFGKGTTVRVVFPTVFNTDLT
ncbi:MAG: histidine kinase [Clostridia bacterium]|nr:histidine kinase [Clostridia bacterium]